MSDSNEGKILFQKAYERLSVAEELHQNGHYEDAVSRSYYAMYYAAKALLSTKGIITKTHRGLIAQISDQYVKSGLLDYETWSTLAHTEPLRESADYGSGEEITEIISKNVLIDSRHFIETCESLFSRNL
ncbi:HEPN domain-containing protein [Methanospirillum lacunae]|uniref:HEPN domain-containing protein n=1 Tax=Methanospirillum lacunae TaxID=668570 RepID=UPI0015E85D9A|nr:HEPN domain-containing protein [Methanospirillum lacunae]